MNESPIVRARRYSNLHLRGKARPAEVQWLRAYPLLWLRVLVMTSQDVESHMGKDRLSLTAIKPKPGDGRQSTEWLAAKAEHDARHTERLRFLGKVKHHIEEVKSLIGTDSVTGPGAQMIGDVVEAWVKLAEMIEEGDYSAARDFANFWAKRWSEYQPTKTQADEAMDAIRQKWGTDV